MTTEQQFLGNEPKVELTGSKIKGPNYELTADGGYIGDRSITVHEAKQLTLGVDPASDFVAVFDTQDSMRLIGFLSKEESAGIKPKFPAHSTPKPSVGRVVLYQLTRADAQSINARREDADMNRPGDKRSGVMVHVGNRAHAGDVYAADIVRVWNDDTVNLQVKLDGNDSYWVTSASKGADLGEWIWPPRV